LIAALLKLVDSRAKLSTFIGTRLMAYDAHGHCLSASGSQQELIVPPLFCLYTSYTGDSYWLVWYPESLAPAATSSLATTSAVGAIHSSPITSSVREPAN
jgi:hypothetical protein